MLNTVIFDMDGVLLDSEAIYLESLRQCLLSVTGRDPVSYTHLIF